MIFFSGACLSNNLRNEVLNVQTISLYHHSFFNSRQSFTMQISAINTSMSILLTLSLREAAHSCSGVLAMGQEAAVSSSPIYPDFNSYMSSDSFDIWSPKCAAITGVGVDMSPHCFIKCPNGSASYTASGSKV